WFSVYPEIVLFAMICVVTLVDVLDTSEQRWPAYALSLLTLAALAILTGAYALSGEVVYGFFNSVRSDPLANWLKCFAALSMLVTFAYAKEYVGQRGMLRGGAEWYVLGLLSLLGCFVLISADNFLLIYLGLECLTLASCALLALRRDHTGALEAAMKYFVLGSLASGVLLYGLSMLYGAAGTLSISEVLAIVAGGGVKPAVLVFALVFVVVGLALKLGVAPFPLWAPDVYQGAPTAAVLLIGTAPKLAVFAMAVRLLVQGLLPLAQDWQPMLALLAVVALLLGNLVAIRQANLKRLLAYATMSHMGFVLLGLMSGVVGPDVQMAVGAYSAAMFTILSYVLATLAAFGVMLVLARKGFESEEIADFAGLHRRQPLCAAVMALAMLSLAGVPPLVGFQGRLLVVQALLAAGRSFYQGLAMFAVVMSVVGAFYCLRVIKVMYVDAPAEDAPIAAQPDMRALLALNGALLLFFGILPGRLLALCGDAVLRMLQN
ncbi:MAG: NADH-quinone oxidoreductase subunit NuoN, partial [Ottowia sp.]|nr:NADH-quinone oxidoreductase subunit NuoN [Ottowia sp.]